MARRCAILLAVLLVATPAAAAPWLVGAWYGQGQPYDKSEMWLAQMLPDGEFRAQFRACIKGKAHDSFDIGSWSLNGDMETIRVVQVNGMAIAPRTDLYKVLAQDGKRQTYRYLGTGFVYHSSRVAPGFQLPDCDLVS